MAPRAALVGVVVAALAVADREAACRARPLPVFVYEPDGPVANAWVADAVAALRGGRLPSAVAVSDPAAACWFLATTGPAAIGAFGDAAAAAAAAPLAALEHWRACGADHVVLMGEHPDDEVPAYDVGGAAVFRYALTRRSWRPRRDVVLPVYYPGPAPAKGSVRPSFVFDSPLSSDVDS